MSINCREFNWHERSKVKGNLLASRAVVVFHKTLNLVVSHVLSCLIEDVEEF